MCTLHKHLYFLLLDILTTRYLFGGPNLSVDIRNETISFVLLWRKPAWFALIFLRIETHFYRPQTKFAKVMFSQVSVCPQGGVCLWFQRGVSATHPWADTPDSPPGQCILGYTCNRFENTWLRMIYCLQIIWWENRRSWSATISHREDMVQAGCD